jgi:hypothetical protein
MSISLRTFCFAAGLSLAAAGAALAPTSALAFGHGGGHGGGFGHGHGHGHWGGGHWGGRWGYGPGLFYDGCFSKRFVNDDGEIFYRRVCY